MALIPSSSSPAAISLGGSCGPRSVEKELAPSFPQYNSSGTATISLNDSAVRTLLGVPSGTISLSSAYGKSNQFTFCLMSGANLCLRTQAVALGWPQNIGVTAIVPSSGVVYSSCINYFALTVRRCFPQGVTLINNGTIAGKGGQGGYANYYSCCKSNYPVNGQPGGGAIRVYNPITIINNGTIGGGGGGGGSAWIGCIGVGYHLWDSAGGGGAGYGAGGLHKPFWPPSSQSVLCRNTYSVFGCNATSGTLTSGGSNPQAYITAPAPDGLRTIRGGDGGGLGAAGGSGYHSPPTCTTRMGGGCGGGAGGSIMGFSHVTLPTGPSGLYGPTSL